MDTVTYDFLRTNIEKALSEGLKKFIIYPFGYYGMAAKEMLNKRYLIEESYIVDNGLAKICDGILSVNDLADKDLTGHCFLVCTEYKNLLNDIIDSIKKCLPMPKIVPILFPRADYPSRIKTLSADVGFLLQTLLDMLFQRSNTKDNRVDFTVFIQQMFNEDNVALSCWASSWWFDKETMGQTFSAYPELFRKVSVDESVVADRYILWGTQLEQGYNIEFIKKIFLYNRQFAIAEAGLLHRVAVNTNDLYYGQGCSFMFDDICPYYDARYSSRLERMLNDENLVLSDSKLKRARNCIDKILKNNLTKFNHQPIYTPRMGRNNARKVLVIDQNPRDKSILGGMAKEKMFQTMFDTAISENSEADIIVKIHPDHNTWNVPTHFDLICQNKNIYFMHDDINPLSLIQYCDEVYVVTSTMGFEAIMCGKHTHIFGMPFYAGWGLGDCRQICPRRTNKRSLEEVFYITYIMYTFYVNPLTNRRCEIEEAIDYLIDARTRYFAEKKNA